MYKFNKPLFNISTPDQKSSGITNNSTEFKISENTGKSFIAPNFSVDRENNHHQVFSIRYKTDNSNELITEIEFRHASEALKWINNNGGTSKYKQFNTFRKHITELKNMNIL